MQRVRADGFPEAPRATPRMVGPWVLGDIIGTGTTGTVRHCVHKYDVSREAAIKIIQVCTLCDQKCVLCINKFFGGKLKFSLLNL